MFKFNEITIEADRGIIFLCGTKYRKNSMYDKRNVLKKYIESKYALKNILILEEHFVFGKRSGYLIRAVPDSIPWTNIIRYAIL